jgi:hypothetical protein
MKKIITLFFCVGAVTAAFAQTSDQDEARRVILSGGRAPKTDQDTRNSRDVILGGDRRVYNEGTTNYPYPGTYPTSGSRQAQVDQVNRDYDAKIRSIQNNNRLSNAEKDRIIRDLNNDRSRVLSQINGRYDNNNRRYDDRRDRRYDDDDRDDDKKYKGNNGNHYGWEKGKGNPHKSGNHSKGKGKNKD